MHQDLPLAIGQERIAVTLEVERVDGLDQGVEGQVARGNAYGLAVSRLHRGGDGDDQRLGDHVHVRFGQGGLAGVHGVLVPRAAAWVVVGRHLIRWLGYERAARTADIDAHEGVEQGFLVQRLASGGVVIGGLGEAFGNAFDQQDASGQPAVHVAGGALPGFLEVAVELRFDGMTLQVVVIEREQRKGEHDHEGRGQQDLMAEFEVFGHDVRDLRRLG